MAIPTPVNGMITDAVTQSNVTVLGQAPAMAMGALNQVLAHSTGLMMENATANSQNANTLSQAVVTASVAKLYGNAPAV